MNVDYNTSLQGKYTLYDENMNVLGETDNLITDWGMRRFVGDVSTGAPHLSVDDIAARVFCSNIINIVLGTNDTPATTSDWQLSTMIPITSYTESNVNTTTGTTLSTDPSNNLAMVFTKMTRFQFNSTFVGTSAIKEIGCSWTNTTFQNNNRYGIFSRATLPLNRQFSVQSNNVIFARYTLTVTTNCSQVLSGMNRLNGTGAVNLPNNRTNVRRLPLYTLPADADFVTPNAVGRTYVYKDTTTWNPNIVNNTLNGGLLGVTGWFDNESRPDDYIEYVQPLFEDPGLNNFIYSGSGARTSTGNPVTPTQDNVYGTSVDDHSAYKIWWLQMYTSSWTGVGDNPSTRFSTFASTTTANLGNSVSIAALNVGVRSPVYATAVQQNLNLIAATPTFTGRKAAEQLRGTVVQTNANTWTRTIQFLFAPGEFKTNTTWFRLYPATLGDWSNSNGSSYTYEDRSGPLTYGIVTVLDSTYTPAASMYDGIRYTFTFTRN